MSSALAIGKLKNCFLEEGRPLNDIQGITCGYWGKEYSQRDIGIALGEGIENREVHSPFMTILVLPR